MEPQPQQEQEYEEYRTQVGKTASRHGSAIIGGTKEEVSEKYRTQVGKTASRHGSAVIGGTKEEVSETVRATEDCSQWRKIVHSAAKPRTAEDG